VRIEPDERRLKTRLLQTGHDANRRTAVTGNADRPLTLFDRLRYPSSQRPKQANHLRLGCFGRRFGGQIGLVDDPICPGQLVELRLSPANEVWG
jgi:hypothetical protein